MAFEYKIDQVFVLTKFSLEKHLNKIGADGWSVYKIDKITDEKDYLDSPQAGKQCYELYMKKEHNERSF